MPRISLTDFVEIVAKSGTPKATKVAQVKNRGSYDPAQDFYKPARDFLVSLHQRSGPRSDLHRMLASLSDPKKITNYPDIVRGYSRWWGRKTLQWFSPPAEIFAAHGVEVSVNPELGLVVNGHRHIIKLYFKGEKLTKTKADIVIHLMAICLGPKTTSGTTMSVLDIRIAKLLTSVGTPPPNLAPALQGELAYIAALWSQV